MKYYSRLILMLIYLATFPVFANDYFQAVKQIQKIPDGAIAVLPCDLAEKKQIVTMLNSYKEFAELKLYENGQISAGYNEDVEIYRGDFSNESELEYALVYTGGTLHANWVKVLKLVNNQVVDAHLDQVIVSHLFPGSRNGLHHGVDTSKFFIHVANPFAIVKNGKTYMRFMEFPPKDEYDKTKLLLCTYLWQGEKLMLTGPNLSFRGPDNSLTAARTAIYDNTIKEPYCMLALGQ